jgi:glycosyltransferase involved in cell wall biosynthesis
VSRRRSFGAYGIEHGIMNENGSPQRDVLFISELPLWPLDQGFRVHGSHMAMALADLGLSVGVASMRETDAALEDAPAALRALALRWPEPEKITPADVEAFARGWGGALAGLRRRIAAHQALDVRQCAGIIPLVRRHRPRVVIGLGQHAPIILAGLSRDALPDAGPVKRVWYAADEPVYFQLSCLRRSEPKAWYGIARRVALYGLIERLFAHRLDGVIGVSPRDTALLRRVGGLHQGITIRNGVDLDYFHPDAWGLPSPSMADGKCRMTDGQNSDATPCDLRPATRDLSMRGGQPHSLVFWGRLDFEPNVDAVCWFAKAVWPTLRWKHPDAVWHIVGKNAHDRVRALCQVPGIDVVGEVADIRPFAQAAAAVILPMRCGGGIKNKLLEAAALGRPIVASPRAVDGLQLPNTPTPLLVAGSVREYLDAIRRVWADAPFAARLGQSARRWVERQHAWAAAARTLSSWLDEVIAPRDAEGSVRSGYADGGARSSGESRHAGRSTATFLPTMKQEKNQTDAATTRRAA